MHRLNHIWRAIPPLILIAAGFYAAVVHAAENLPPLDYLLTEVEKRYTASQFSADFLQESTFNSMEITDFASGRLYVRYPGMMRWEYEKPERQVIITDGKQLWIYRPQDNQVMVGGLLFKSTLRYRKINFLTTSAYLKYIFQVNRKP